jgi:hypothetical protein
MSLTSGICLFIADGREIRHLFFQSFADQLSQMGANAVRNCGIVWHMAESGGKRAAIQTLRAIVGLGKVASAFGLRLLQHRF